jgi:hypothetical protein
VKISQENKKDGDLVKFRSQQFDGLKSYVQNQTFELSQVSFFKKSNEIMGGRTTLLR